MTDVWLRPDEAAAWLGVSVPAVHVLAHRREWERRGKGREVRYLFDAVVAERDTRVGCLTQRSV